jgi:hypothetical protein
VIRGKLEGCFRNQLLLIDVQLLLAKALAANFDLTGSCEAKFGYDLFLSKALERSHQQLITEAPVRLPIDTRRIDAQDLGKGQVLPHIPQLRKVVIHDLNPSGASAPPGKRRSGSRLDRHSPPLLRRVGKRPI